MDYCKLKSEILDLSNKLMHINGIYKTDDNAMNFIETEKNLILQLSNQISTTFNIIKKLRNSKKRKLFDGALNSSMKLKKLNEKTYVCIQLKEHQSNQTNSHLQLDNYSNKKQLHRRIDDANQKSQKPKECDTKKFNEFDVHECPSKNCYICKKVFKETHFFYDSMCKECAEFNYAKRNQKCDFTGKVAVITGCRIKIGFEICLYLLRNNCSRVIGTTRFPKDAFVKFSQQPDFNSFKDRLNIYPLDLRDLKSVNTFIKHLYETLPKLDILINNAAQTLRRNIKYYEHLLGIESQPFENFDESIKKILSTDNKDQWSYKFANNFAIMSNDNEDHLTLHAKDSQLSLSVVQSQIPLLDEDFKPNLDHFPKDVYDKDHQQVDLASKSSWNKKIDEVDMFEFAETQVINSWSPFLLCSRLKELMTRNKQEPKFIVNVSSMEGKFYRYKNVTHPHTNMSKASLNMLTRTCGADFAQHNIFMTSVDTGWVSEMSQHHLYKFERTVPLDEFDGAIRVLDPIIQGYQNKKYFYSVFLKDYTETDW